MQSKQRSKKRVCCSKCICSRQATGELYAVTNTTSVKQDLVISAYKPNMGLEERFKQPAVVKNRYGILSAPI